MLPALKGSEFAKVAVDIAEHRPVWQFPKVTTRGKTAAQLEVMLAEKSAGAPSAEAVQVMERVVEVSQVDQTGACFVMTKAIQLVKSRGTGIILAPRAESSSADFMVM